MGVVVFEVFLEKYKSEEITVAYVNYIWATKDPASFTAAIPA